MHWAILILLLLLSASANTQQTPNQLILHITNNPPSTYLGWSTWSLQATKTEGYGFYWLNETNVKAQVEILATQFSKFGYDRVNLDSGWQDPQLDEYGRTRLNTKKFPSGIHKFQSYLSSKNFKLGLYYLPGIDSRAVKNQLPIKNTQYTADEIILCPRKKRNSEDAANHRKCKPPMANAFGAGHALNYSHPGSQMYVNSIVDELYNWNVSFVKLDGLVPGSSFHPEKEMVCDTRADLAAWRKAIEERYEEEWQHVGREKIWLVASWGIPTSEGPTMDQNTNSWRVEQDIEAYSTKMTTFDRVIRNVKTATLWTSIERNRQWQGQIDLDSVLVSDMTYHESQSMVTIWAMLGSPIYSGDDLTTLPESRKALLTNPEVLSLARLAATNPARLDGFDELDTLGQRRKDELISCQKLKEQRRELEEKRKMVVELSLFQNLTSSPSLIDYYYSSNCLQDSLAPNITPLITDQSDTKDIWALQLWVLQLDLDHIYVAVVNAGQQSITDQSVQVELNLSKLKQIKHVNEHVEEEEEGGGLGDDDYNKKKLYVVRDVWKKLDIGLVQLDSSIQFTLDVHASKLFKFTASS